ncbi:MAG: hypothetical protein KA313_08455 [Pseudarcicella sp.]|nr:hypothetical protein [Pseudarcicella sp.]
MKNTLLALLLTLIAFSSKSQDKIILKHNYMLIRCKITKEDSLKLYYFKNSRNEISEHEVLKVDVADYSYNSDSNKNPFLADYDTQSLGLGMGLDYGGIGINLLSYFTKNLGAFAGAGYNLADLGYNFGLKIRSNPENNAGSLYTSFMYGYNLVYVIEGAEQLNKVFYGPSLGIGWDSKYYPGSPGYFTLGIILPFRSKESEEYYNILTSNPNIMGLSKPIPIAINFGYRFVF